MKKFIALLATVLCLSSGFATAADLPTFNPDQELSWQQSCYVHCTMHDFDGNCISWSETCY